LAVMGNPSPFSALAAEKDDTVRISYKNTQRRPCKLFLSVYMATQRPSLLLANICKVSTCYAIEKTNSREGKWGQAINAVLAAGVGRKVEDNSNDYKMFGFLLFFLFYDRDQNWLLEVTALHYLCLSICCRQGCH
jgi:hypothetical protein